jgi:hypothetical protein
MKKPNFILLCLAAWLSIASGIYAATEPASAPTADTVGQAPAASTSTTTSATTASNVPTSAVPLAVTPAAAFAHPNQLNLARWYTGAAIVVTQPDGEPKSLAFAERDQSPYSALLSEDATASAPIGPGPTRIVIDLTHPQIIDHMGFYSFSATGTVDVYYSSTVLAPTSTHWKLTNVRANFSADKAISIQLQPLDARYIMLAFNPTQAGSIGALSIFAKNGMIGRATAPVQPGVNGVPPSTDPSQRAVDFDFGPSAFGSRVTHVSGGNVSQAQNAIDGDPKTAVVLGGNQTQSQDNILVVDLGATRVVDKLSLLFGSQGPGKLEFYMLNDLPPSLKGAPPATPAKPTSFLQPNIATPFLLASTSDALAEALALSQMTATDIDVQTAYLPPDFFTSHAPNFVKTITGNEERMGEKFDKLPCRYLIIRWVPDKPAAGSSEAAAPPSQALSLYEVNLIGPVPEEAYAAAMADFVFSPSTAGTTGTTGTSSSPSSTSSSPSGTASAPPGGGLGPGPPPPVSP